MTGAQARALCPPDEVTVYGDTDEEDTFHISQIHVLTGADPVVHLMKLNGDSLSVRASDMS